MEQISITPTLPCKEKKNVFLAIAVGSMNTINSSIPGPDHKKQKRCLSQFSTDLLHYVGPQLPPVAPHNMQLFQDTIIAGGRVLEQILDETGFQGAHVMLNLAGFCMEQLPTNKRLEKRYMKLFEMWEGARKYKDVRSGERIFCRIESELEILITQRKGCIV